LHDRRFRDKEKDEMSHILQQRIFRAIFSALFVMVSLVAPAAWTAARAAGENIGPSYIPQKNIPKKVRYRQAPAYDKRARNNRRLVTKVRKADRQLKRTGTAYED
jgi:hypothetical protein